MGIYTNSGNNLLQIEISPDQLEKIKSDKNIIQEGKLPRWYEN